MDPTDPDPDADPQNWKKQKLSLCKNKAGR
jgi:hypothetical protein